MAKYMLLIHGEEGGWEATSSSTATLETAVACSTAIPGASTGAVE